VSSALINEYTHNIQASDSNGSLVQSEDVIATALSARHAKLRSDFTRNRSPTEKL